MNRTDLQNPKITELLNMHSHSFHSTTSIKIDENSNISKTTEKGSAEDTFDDPISLVPHLQKLNIESSKNEDHYNFGKIENIVAKMGLILIQSTNSKIVVDIDSPVFLLLPPEEKYTFLGEIDDIFGSIGKPMYSVRVTPGILQKFHLIIETPVYLRLGHPDTSVLHIENMGNEKYNVVSKQQDSRME